LSGRAEDTGSKKQISTKAFIELAQSIGVNVTADISGPNSIAELIAREPLNKILQPIDPTTPDIIKYAGNDESGQDQMDPADSEQVVAANAKSAMKGFGK
jgi:hypothetical protein